MEELKFEKLSDVDVVEEPSEESHVLIVEGGEVKKAPKTAVGGGGEPDAVIKLREEDYNFISGEYIKGSYDVVKEILDNGAIPKIEVILEVLYAGTNYVYRGVPNIVWTQDNNDGRISMYFSTGYSSYVYLNPDGTVEK